MRTMRLTNGTKDDTGYTAAKGVGEDLGYQERVRRAAAPLFGPQSQPAEAFEAPDLISAARKAAQAAAMAASAMRQNTKAYEKMNVPAFPKGGELTN